MLCGAVVPWLILAWFILIVKADIKMVAQKESCS